ncbi:MAG: nicotinate (nicotinamide) nucleotide adenylyltransferase [Gaiellales bacterium]
MSRRIGVLGSLCNPPHVGHAALARCAAAQLGLERVLLIPTGDPVHRPAPAVPPSVRLLLAEAAAADEPLLEVSSVEVDRPGPSYMADTLELLGLQVAGAELVLLLGADQYAELDRWHDPARIRRTAAIAVAPRDEAPIELEPGVELIAMEPVDASSTVIRRRIADGEPIDGLVAPAVARAIAEHGLYQT